MEIMDYDFDANTETVTLSGIRYAPYKILVEGQFGTEFVSTVRVAPLLSEITYARLELNREEQFINMSKWPGHFLEGRNYKIRDERGRPAANSESSKSLSELSITRPYLKSFELNLPPAEVESYEVKPGLRSYTIGRFLTYRDTTRKEILFESPADLRVLPEKYLIDQNRGYTMVLEKRWTKGGDRFESYKSKALVAYDLNEGGTNEQELSFEYPRYTDFHQGLTQYPGGGSYDLGAVFVGGKPFGVSKKNSHPDPTLYDMIITDNLGEITFNGTFNFGSDKRKLVPLYALSSGRDQVWLLARSRGKDNAGMAMLTFHRATGMLGVAEIPRTQYNADHLRQPVLNAISAFSDFNVSDIFWINNNEVVILAEAKQDQPFATSVNGQPVPEEYLGYYVFHLTDEGIRSHYVIPKHQKTLRPGQLVLLDMSGDKLTLMTRDELAQSAGPLQTFSFVNIDLDERKMSFQYPLGKGPIDGEVQWVIKPHESEVAIISERPVGGGTDLKVDIYSLD